jgi:hypothetical protein
MSTLAKPTLDNKAQMAEAFAKGSPAKSAKVTKIFHAPEGYRRLTINLREDIHKKIRMKAIEQDCTVTDIITKLLEKEVR